MNPKLQENDRRNPGIFFEVIAEGATRNDAVRVAQDDLPDIILLDISMPGGGIDAAQDISSVCPFVRIVMLTVSEDEADVSAALRAGAQRKRLNLHLPASCSRLRAQTTQSAFGMLERF